MSVELFYKIQYNALRFVASLSCVQCTTDSDKNCETKTKASPCPRSSYNYCAATRTAVLNLGKLILLVHLSFKATGAARVRLMFPKFLV